MSGIVQLAPAVARFVSSVGLDVARIPAGLARPAPFQQTGADIDDVIAWVARERPLFELGERFEPLRARVRDESLRTLAKTDADAAARYAAVGVVAPLEDVLHLGALTRMSALVAARSPVAVESVLASAPLLQAPRPVARTAVLRLAEIGIGEGSMARRARAVLEDALQAAIARAHELGEDHAAVAAGRVIDVVGSLAALAAHREGLTQRMSALAVEVPPFVGPFYVVAYLAGLGAAHAGPYMHEVRERLLDAANDADERVRALAIESLAEPAKHDVALVPQIEAAVFDPDPDVRIAAALALSELGACSDKVAYELLDLIELDDAESIASTLALVRARRTVPDEALGKLDDPIVQAAARLLVSPGQDARFAALLDAYADADPDELEDLEPRLHPLAILSDTLQGMPAQRAATWLARFAAAEPGSDTIAEVFYQALDDSETIPDALVEAGAPLLDTIERLDEGRAALALMLASRLLPAHPRLEPLVLAHAEAPVSLIALAQLERISTANVDPLLEILNDPDDDYDEELAALAIAALSRIDEPVVATSLASMFADHVRDDDPLSEAAHAAILELIARDLVT